MNNKLSELSKPEQFDAEVEIHGGEPFAVWAPAINGSHVKAEQYFALLAELEAKTKHIADMEHIVAAAKCDDELWDAMAHRLKTLEAKLATLKNEFGELWKGNVDLLAKLATPVRLPEKFSMLHRTDFHEDYHSTMAFKSVEVFDAIRAAGFTFTVGDE